MLGNIEKRNNIRIYLNGWNRYDRTKWSKWFHKFDWKKIIRKNDFKVFRVDELRINTDSLEPNYFLDEYDRGTLGGSYEGIKSILKNYKVVE